MAVPLGDSGITRYNGSMYNLAVLGQLLIFARAGGGGSSSGGGFVIFAIPMVVAMSVAGLVKTFTKSKPAAIAVGSLAGLLVSLFYLFIGPVTFIFVAISALVGALIGAFTDKISRFRKGSEAAKQVIQQASAQDSAWNEQGIINYTSSVFNRFQYDWERMDLPSIQQYVTPHYARHIGLMLYALQQMGRVNRMKNVSISDAVITRAHDDADDRNDRVSVSFVASASDELVDVVSGKVLHSDFDDFGEQWNFVRSGDGWLLEGIDQATEDSAQLVASMQQFAAQYNMYFSPDWGRLLLPTRGELFKRGFEGADINNHVIGFWTGDLLVQLYTYVAEASNNDSAATYIIGQVNLPKSYGGILVERRDSRFLKRFRAPSGYKKVELEWGDFNKRYQVYATDENQVTSFELLNPSFMAWLYDQNIKVNIEVVDNIVYLYAKISTGEMRYVEMMDILQKSHKELKM